MTMPVDQESKPIEGIVSPVDLQSITDAEGLKSYVSDLGIRVLSEAIVEGDRLYIEVGDLEKIGKDDNKAEELIKSHRVGSAAKEIGILLRDVIFEIQKAELLFEESKIDEQKCSNLIDRSKQTIRDVEQFIGIVLDKKELSTFNAAEIVKQDHPWPVYKVQLETLIEQIELLPQNQKDLALLLAGIAEVKTAIEEGLEAMQNRFQVLLDQCSEILFHSNPESIDRFIVLLNSTNQLLDDPGFESTAHRSIEKALLTAPVKMTPKVGVLGGALIEEDLIPQYQLEQWCEVEILPMMEQAYNQIDGTVYNFRLSLLNISNRLELIQQKSNGLDITEYLLPLKKQQNDLEAGQIQLSQTINDITEKINEQLTVATLLNKDVEFLSLGFNSSVNRFRKEQNFVLNRIAEVWTWMKDKYFSIKSTVHEESRLGDVEKVIRYIQAAKVDRRNVQYNNFFNAKVTMVDAFWIGRDLEQKRIEQAFESWSNGFSGAILLKGDRFSGKTSLGDWLSQKHFRGKTYVLQPGRPILISNNEVDIGKDLVQGIKSFIERVQYAKPLIWIDDLELWFDDEHLSDDVMDKLVAIINEYGKKVFFAISLGSWMYRRLNKFIDLDHTFQASIELTPFSKELVKEAIMLRHGASHKTLVNKKGQELSKIEFDRHVGQIWRQSEGNIGYALQLWANSVHYKDDQHVEMGELYKYRFPDIINSDNGVLLTTLLMHRKIHVDNLARLMGPSYNDSYRIHVAVLTGYGVIKKAFNGVLTINEKVVPEITRILQNNRFI